jgi:hypothetical protein
VEEAKSYYRSIYAYARGAAINAVCSNRLTMDTSGTAAVGNAGNGECLAVTPGAYPNWWCMTLVWAFASTYYETWPWPPAADFGDYQYTVRCKYAIADGGVFDVFEQDSEKRDLRFIGQALAGTRFEHDQLNFTIKAGSVDFVPGDEFTITCRLNDIIKQTTPNTYPWLGYAFPRERINIDARQGQLSVYRVRLYNDGNTVEELIKTVDMDEDGLRYDYGPVHKSITLTGHRIESYAPKKRAMSGATAEVIKNNRYQYRLWPDFVLRPGDIISTTDKEFTARAVHWRVAPGDEVMEIWERE